MLPWGVDFVDSDGAKALGELGYAILYQPRDQNDPVLQSGTKTGATDAAVLRWNRTDRAWQCILQIECRNVADKYKVTPANILGGKCAFRTNTSNIAVLICRCSYTFGVEAGVFFETDSDGHLIITIQLGKDCEYL